jgi:hypothetical protein
MCPLSILGWAAGRQMLFMNPYYVGAVPAFVDIEDVNSVYQLISQKVENN